MAIAAAVDRVPLFPESRRIRRGNDLEFAARAIGRCRAVLAGVLVLAIAGPMAAANSPPRVSVIDVTGAISPATAEYVVRATIQAGATDAQCLIVRLDTPGGLLESTKQIVQAFYASPRPVVVYVAPAGANAGSAGCFITLAADVAAMAPNTSIGAAHPVEFGGFNRGEMDEVMRTKIENFASSYIEAIANKQRRNAEWAISAVRDSASITAEKALELRVIDRIATDLPDLLRQLDGQTIRGARLATAQAQLEPIPLLLRERVFQLLWRPELLFVLMLIAIYGIIGELSSPGAILPGVVGAIALVLALYMSSALPVNAAGIALLVLAVLLFVADAFATTHGVLTTGGIIAFFLGAWLLFEGAGPAFRLPLWLIVPATVITALFFIFVLGSGLRAQKLPVRVGREILAGRTAETLTPVHVEGGRVWIEGENWNATSETPIPAHQPVEVTAVRGLTLLVKPQKPEEHS